MDVTSSSVKLAITLESPRGPIQSGPETRLSSLFTGYESGKKQCIGKDSVELVGVKPSCIESITSLPEVCPTTGSIREETRRVRVLRREK